MLTQNADLTESIVRAKRQNLAAQVLDLSGQAIELCYHCHKCASGCPVIGSMVYGPDRILRMVAFDQRDAVLSSMDIWLCSGCFACAIRCPNDIDISAVMDALRQAAMSEGFPAGERDVLLFHRLFLGVIRYLGRSHEAAMLGLFKMFSHIPIQNDLKAGLSLLLRGKVPIIPREIAAAAEVQKIYQRSQ